LGYAAFCDWCLYHWLLSSHNLIEWNFWVVIPIAAAVAALAGIILGYPTLPLRGDYLAIVTLGFGEIVPVVFRNLTSVQIYEPISKIFCWHIKSPRDGNLSSGLPKPINLTGGEAGINPIGRPYLPFIGSFKLVNIFPGTIWFCF
jgi:branched-chain amino acid transport system permease protein